MSGTHLALKTSLKKREHSSIKNRNKNEFSTSKMWPFPCLRYNIPQSSSRTSLWVGRLEPEAQGEAAEGRGSCQLQQGLWSWHVTHSWEKNGITFPSPFNPFWTTSAIHLNSWGLSGSKENLSNPPAAFSEREDTTKRNFFASFQHQTWSLYLRQVYTYITQKHVCMLWFTWQCLS